MTCAPRMAALMLAVIGTIGGAAHAWGAPITFNTALPVAKGEFVFREQFVVAQSGEDASGADRDRRLLAAISVLGYGVSGKLAVFGVLPYVDKALAVTVAGLRQHRSASAQHRFPDRLGPVGSAGGGRGEQCGHPAWSKLSAGDPDRRRHLG